MVRIAIAQRKSRDADHTLRNLVGEVEGVGRTGFDLGTLNLQRHDIAPEFEYARTKPVPAMAIYAPWLNQPFLIKKGTPFSKRLK
jgi:hypothetical protein